MLSDKLFARHYSIEYLDFLVFFNVFDGIPIRLRTPETLLSWDLFFISLFIECRWILDHLILLTCPQVLISHICGRMFARNCLLKIKTNRILWFFTLQKNNSLWSLSDHRESFYNLNITRYWAPLLGGNSTHITMPVLANRRSVPSKRGHLFSVFFC
jgi:hypothetical protein